MKRSICLLLLLSCLLSLLPVVPVQAQELSWASGQYVQPQYADTELPPVPQPVSARAAKSFLTETQAVAQLRKQMVAREQSISLDYITGQDVYTSVSTLLDRAMVHTGKPKEGDYLQRQYRGFSWSGSYYVDPTDGLYRVSVTLGVSYITTAQQEAKVDQAVADLLKKLDLKGNTPYQQIDSIYEYILDHVSYDSKHLSDSSYKLKHSCYAALIDGTAVCQGYSLLFYRLALELGIDCRYISGTGSGGPHGWNIVKLDGKYYNVDTTWDAGRPSQSWFLKSTADFKFHQREAAADTAKYHAAYPMAKTSYVYDPVRSNIQITKQPTSVKAKTGTKISLKIAALGEGLKYRWYVKAPGSSKYTRSSVTGKTYSCTLTAASSGSKVYCMITDAEGNMLQSSTATLTATGAALKITAQPKSTTVSVGQKASVTVKAQGDGLKYQWYYKDPGSSKYTKTSVTGATYSVTMTAARSGRKVYCVVRDAKGGKVQTSTVTLTAGKALKITRQPVSVTVASGKTAKVTLEAQGDGLTYKWYFAEKGSAEYKSTSSFKGSSYSVAMTASRSGRKVYCVIRDKYGNSVRTNTVTLRMSGALEITAQPKSVAVYDGKTATVTVKASGTGLRYQWYVRDAGAKSFTKSSVKTSSYSVKMASGRNGRQAYCVITDASGKQVKTATVTMRTKTLKITAQPKSKEGLPGDKLTFKATAYGSGLSYTWYCSRPGQKEFKAMGSYQTLEVELSTMWDGARFYCVVTDRYGKTVKTATVTAALLKAEKVVLGKWNVYMAYSEKNDRFRELAKGKATMTVNADGTAVICAGKQSYALTWEHTRIKKGSIYYHFHTKDGKQLVVSYDPDNGELVLLSGNDGYFLRR